MMPPQMARPRSPRDIPFSSFSFRRTGGAARARNIGARASKGEILFFLDSDVLLPKDAILTIERAFEEDEGLAGFNGIYAGETPAPGFLSRMKNLYLHYLCLKQREEYSAFWSAIMIIRRDIFFALGGFDEDFKTTLEDVEFGMRLSKRGVRFKVNPGLVGTHLKRFGLWSLLRTDYQRAHTLAKLFMERDQEETALYRRAIGGKGFLGASAPGLIPLGLILTPFQPWGLALSALGLILYIYSRYEMLCFFFRRGFTFGLGSFGVLLLELLVAQMAGLRASIGRLSFVVRPRRVS